MEADFVEAVFFFGDGDVLCLCSEVAIIEGTAIRIGDCGADEVLHLYTYIYMRGKERNIIYQYTYIDDSEVYVYMYT